MKSECPTTDELSVRIKDGVRTIRERLRDAVSLASGDAPESIGRQLGHMRTEMPFGVYIPALQAQGRAEVQQQADQIQPVNWWERSIHPGTDTPKSAQPPPTFWPPASRDWVAPDPWRT